MDGRFGFFSAFSAEPLLILRSLFPTKEWTIFFLNYHLIIFFIDFNHNMAFETLHIY